MAQQPDVSIPPLTRKPRKNPVFWIIGLAVVLAIVGVSIVPGFYLEERLRGRHAWRKYEAEAKARGVKLDFAEFIPPKVPDAENFARIPMFDAALADTSGGKDVPTPFKLPESQGNLLELGNPTMQSRVNFVAWQNCFVAAKLLPAASENSASDVLQALDHYAAPLAELGEAAKRPHCRFAVRWEEGPAMGMPQYIVLEGAAKLYLLRLDAYLAQGDSAAALADFRTGLALVRAIRHDPVVLAALMRQGMLRRMEAGVWEGLIRHRWTNKELSAIEEELVQFDPLGDYVFALTSERGAQNLNYDRAAADRKFLIQSVRGQDGGLPEMFWRLYPSGWIFDCKVQQNVFFDEMLARVDPPRHRWFSDRQVASRWDRMKDDFQKTHYMLFGVGLSTFDAVERMTIHAATLTDETRIACALERFQRARGVYPQTLAELAPEFIPQVPSEVVNGEQYHYRRTDDGSFLLYSVGVDLQDDGGKTVPRRGESFQPDWPWRYPHL